jgi:hypothetical protein
MQKHFATNRLIGSPQQRGRTPPPVFSNAIETPPATKGWRKRGARPEAKKFTALVKVLKKEVESEGKHCWSKDGR